MNMEQYNPKKRVQFAKIRQTRRSREKNEEKKDKFCHTPEKSVQITRRQKKKTHSTQLLSFVRIARRGSNRPSSEQLAHTPPFLRRRHLRLRALELCDDLIPFRAQLRVRVPRSREDAPEARVLNLRLARAQVAVGDAERDVEREVELVGLLPGENLINNNGKAEHVSLGVVRAVARDLGRM